MSDILIVSEQRRGAISPIVAEMINAAKDLAASNGGKVNVAILAQDPSEFVPQLSLQGVEQITTIALSDAEFQSDVFRDAVLALAAEMKPAVIMLPHSINSLGYAPALAVKGGYGLASDVFGVSYDGGDLVATRQAYQEKAFVELDFPGKETAVLTIRGGSFKPAEGSATPDVTSFEAPATTAQTRHIAFHDPEASGGPDLSAAELILSIGRGVADEDNVAQFEELAETLGFNLGCSRPIADSGWLPKFRQIGQSGKIASSCKVYIALGISGSVQHLAGMKHVPNIIAVNKDPEASIFTVARYGVVGDIFEIAEELKAQLG